VVGYLASPADRTEDGGMRRALATLCVCWLAWCGAPRSNTVPLAFGMTPQEASAALGLPLTYHSGSRGSEIYLATTQAGIPGFYPVDHGLALQFRRGRLTGWKKDWQLRRPGPF
jgi:hypothetical protein